MLRLAARTARMGDDMAERASNRISAGRSALRIAGRGAEGLLPHQGGAVGDLLLGQAGHGGHAARAGGGAEGLRQEFRRARHRLRPFRVRRRPRHARHLVLHAARRPRGGGQVRRRRADEQGRRLPAKSKSTAGRTASASARPTIAARACSSSCAPGRRPARNEFFRKHLHAHESYFASYGDSFIFRGPIRSADGADNIGTALLLELPDRAAADKFWNEEPFAKNGGYQRDARIVRWVFGD